MTDLNTVFGELDRLGERLEEVAFFALDEYAGEKVEQLREKISINFPPASQQGEYPRKRTGNLANGLFHVTTGEVTSFNSVIWSTRPGGVEGVPGRLNYSLDRPYMRYTYELIVEEFPIAIRRKIHERW